MSARRALVTGVAGQDGSYLAELLLREGREVIGLVRPPLERAFPNLEAIRDRLVLVAADVSDLEALDAAIRDARPDDVFHLAAPTFVPASWEDPAATMAAIAGGTATVLRVARDLGARVLVASSPEVFGDAGVSPQREDSPRRPRSPYGVAKLAAHELVGVLREGGGVHGCSVVTYNHASPRRPEQFVDRKITRAAAAISLGREREVALGDLEARRDWSHARDVVRGLHLALAHDEPGDYVLASGAARTVGEFARAAFAAVGLDAGSHVRVDPAFVRPPEPTVLVGDPTKARDVLGWVPEVSFEELVAEMVAADLERLAPQK